MYCKTLPENSIATSAIYGRLMCTNLSSDLAPRSVSGELVLFDSKKVALELIPI
jgi:hypothetical protein